MSLLSRREYQYAHFSSPKSFKIERLNYISGEWENYLGSKDPIVPYVSYTRS
jgi:hypothetical protein